MLLDKGSSRVALTTTQPSNSSEFQLYNLLKRANLLQYYDTFIAQGTSSDYFFVFASCQLNWDRL